MGNVELYVGESVVEKFTATGIIPLLSDTNVKTCFIFNHKTL
jgi:hypothetical protein